MSDFTKVHYANPFNSTEFTNCCGTAVLRDEDECQSCGNTVIRIAKAPQPLKGE